MKAVEREKAVQLRLRYQMPYGEIMKRLKVSKGTLSRWLAGLPLSEARILELRRAGWSRGEAKRERFRQTMREKREEKEREIYKAARKTLLKIGDQTLFIAGLMLYAAEGEKKSTSDISFTNTDDTLVRFFSRWVVRYLGLPKEKFRIQLHIYENMDIRKEETFWLRKLGFSRKQLWITQVKQLRPKSFTYRDTSRHGTCKLYIGSVPSKAKLMLSIRAFFDTYEEHLRA